MKNLLLIGILATAAAGGGWYVYHTGNTTPVYVGLAILVALFVLSFVYLAVFRSKAMEGIHRGEPSEDGHDKPAKKESSLSFPTIVHKGSGLPWGTVILAVVVFALLWWMIFLGGWDKLTSWIPKSRTVQHTQVVYKTRVERPTFVPMTQAEICRSAPAVLMHAKFSVWTKMVHVPAGCAAKLDPAPDSGLYATQCRGVDGNWPVACDEYTDVQLQRVGEDDGTDLVVTMVFVPLVPKR